MSTRQISVLVAIGIFAATGCGDDKLPGMGGNAGTAGVGGAGHGGAGGGAGTSAGGKAAGGSSGGSGDSVGGSANGGGGSSGVAGGSAGNAGKGGSAGIAGSSGAESGSGGSAGSTGSNCPLAPPLDASNCGGPSTCFYQDCATYGRSVANCTGGQWSVTSAACAAFSCSTGVPCQPEDICRERGSVVITRQCIANPCTTDEVSCACITACDNCAVTGTAQGIHITCSNN